MMVLRTIQSGGSSHTGVLLATHDERRGRERARARKESDQNVQRKMPKCMNARGTEECDEHINYLVRPFFGLLLRAFLSFVHPSVAGMAYG